MRCCSPAGPSSRATCRCLAATWPVAVIVSSAGPGCAQPLAQPETCSVTPDGAKARASGASASASPLASYKFYSGEGGIRDGIPPGQLEYKLRRMVNDYLQPPKVTRKMEIGLARFEAIRDDLDQIVAPAQRRLF
mgnify:CR=1 FL=1